uniref:Nuclear receptor domain-containing protein n=1 Tax=Panagrellus redivivus TaxID=6233 RepID=A0A7E4VB94_PANRE
MSATTTDYSNEAKHEFDEERSPTPTSEEYTDSEDEEASRDSISFSRIRLRDADSNLPDASNEDGMPTNFAGMKFDLGDTLSSSLPSTSEHEGRSPSDAAGTGSNNGGRKRTFSNSESTPKDTPTEKRTATKICRVCGDKAYSYNFNVITCESCKAFFRRNANKEKEIRCPFNDQCDINIVSRRFCQRCRLQKCFRVGMKKEWIMSEEARLEKKQRILDNRERRAAERMMEDKGQGLQMSPEGNSNMASNMSNGDATMTSFAAPVPQPQQNGVSPPNTAVEELAAAIAAPVAVQQQAQAAVVAAALLQSAAPVAAPVIPAVVPPVTLMPTAPQPVPQTSEVAQYAAAVATAVANAAANAAPPAVAPPASFPTHNDAGQMATERALAASILTNVAQPPGHELNVQAAQMVNPIAAVQLQQQVANYQAAQQVIAQAEAQAQAVNHIVQQQQAVAAAQQQQQQQQAQQQQAQNLVAAAVAAASIVGSLESTVVTAPPPAMVTAASIGSVSQPTSAPITTSSPDENNLQDLISVPRDIFIKLIENRKESDQGHNPLNPPPGHNPLNPPPVKCQCHCNCGRYPNELLIVDKVMTDLLENSTKYNNTRPMAQLSQKTVNNTTPIPMDTTPPLVQVQAPQAIMQPVQVQVPVPPQQVAPQQMFAIQPMPTQMQQVMQPMSAQQMQTAMSQPMSAQQIQTAMSQPMSAQQMQPMSAQQIQTAMTQPMNGITNFAPMVTGMPSMHDQQQQQQQQHQEYMYHQPSMQTSAAC